MCVDAAIIAVGHAAQGVHADLVARDHLPGRAHQDFQDALLGAGQHHLVGAQAGPAGSRVQAQCADRQTGRGGLGISSKRRSTAVMRAFSSRGLKGLVR